MTTLQSHESIDGAELLWPFLDYIDLPKMSSVFRLAKWLKF